MANVRPVNVLDNYTEVIAQVTYGNPIYLEGNGDINVAIISSRELDELRAVKNLFSELEKGEVSAQKKGWVSYEDARKALGV